MSPPLTTRSLRLFLDYARDAANWDGMPLVGGNVGRTPADKGNLTALKKAGLLTTSTDDLHGVPSAWVLFTPLGIALAAEHGIDLSWV